MRIRFEPYSRIVLAYVLLSLVWLFGSNFFALSFTHYDFNRFARIEIIIGIAFIILSAAVLIFLLRNNSRRYEADSRDERQAKEISIEALKRYELFAMATQNGIRDFDFSSRQVFVNDAMTKLFGYTTQDLLDYSRWWNSVIHPDDLDRVMKEYFTVVEKRDERWSSEYRILAKDGSWRYVEDHHVFMYDSEGEVRRIVASLRDITVRHNLYETLKEERIQYEKNIAREVLAAEERERRRLAGELHDNVNQLLIVSQILLSRYLKNNQEKGIDKVEESATIIARAIKELRHLAHGLASSHEKKTSLFDTLQIIKNDVQLTGAIRIGLDFDAVNEDEIPEEKKLLLLRIVQEQVSNVLKHSGADQMNIFLRRLGDNVICVMIRDNGKGFDINTIPAGGFGFRNIRNRVYLYNGKMSINSSPGKGCVLEVEV